MTGRIHHGDSEFWLDTIEPGTLDACVTDPPYELGFMGRAWDSSGIAFQREFWKKVMRALKPGAHLAAFGGTRTYHRIACAIEDAGFEVRDCLMWTYGQGFPKSLNVSKAIDKAAGAERPVIGTHERDNFRKDGAGFRNLPGVADESRGTIDLTGSATPEAIAWDGWGTALKPAWEPIILARKPLGEGNVAANVLKHGTGAVNVGACRLPSGGTHGSADSAGAGAGYEAHNKPGRKYGANLGGIVSAPHASGRWPANVLLTHAPECVCVGTREVAKHSGADTMTPTTHTGPAAFLEDTTKRERHQFNYGTETGELWACVPGCPVRMLDEQSGKSKSPKPYDRATSARNKAAYGVGLGDKAEGASDVNYGDSGGASRFFYCAKAPTAERSAGLPEGERNMHPTVKPLGVMRWLVRLLTPSGGTVLEPFAGSGTTCCACELEGVGYEACEKDADNEGHIRVARLRVEHWRGVAEKAALDELNREPLLDLLEAKAL